MGQGAFARLITSIKILQLDHKYYMLQGHVHVLLTWAYEHIYGIGETYSKRRVKEKEKDLDEVPLLNWFSGRSRYKYKDFISKEKTNHRKVSILHLFILFKLLSI